MPTFTARYTFGFAVTICVVLSVAVASAAQGLRPYQEVNKRRDLQQNILAALGLPEDGAPVSGAEIDQLYEERVERVIVDANGEVVPDATMEQVKQEWKTARVEGTPPSVMPVYMRKDGDRVGAYAIYTQGNGLWGPLEGYLAIAPDGHTILGTTFFAEKETPGLGAEIQETPFERQWEGKKIVGPDGEPATIHVVKGEPSLLCPGREDYCVEGISGGTNTSRGVDVMVERALEYYQPYLDEIRQGGTR